MLGIGVGWDAWDWGAWGARRARGAPAPLLPSGWGWMFFPWGSVQDFPSLGWGLGWESFLPWGGGGDGGKVSKRATTTLGVGGIRSDPRSQVPAAAGR